MRGTRFFLQKLCGTFASTGRLFFACAVLGLPGWADADVVNLIQDNRAIECRPPAKAKADFERLEIDAKDLHLVLFGADKKVTTFDQLKFLDSAVLMKRSGKEQPGARGGEQEVALFQIQRNGEPFLLQGELFSLEEKNCDEAGAAKVCKTPRIDKFTWSPESLEFKISKETLRADVSQYGVFSGRGTFFIAETSGANGEPVALAVLDYGAKIDLVIGPLIKLDCHEVPGSFSRSRAASSSR